MCGFAYHRNNEDKLFELSCLVILNPLTSFVRFISAFVSQFFTERNTFCSLIKNLQV